MVFQRHWRPEDGHDAVAGELVDGSAITLHDVGASIEQLRHEFAQTFGADRSGDAHRMHDVGEQHRHLFVLSHRPGLGNGCTALVAELCVGT